MFDDLETIPEAVKSAGAHVCERCRGTGKYTYRNGMTYPCGKCRSTGRLHTSYEQRAKARASAAKTKAKKEFENINLFKEQEPVAFEWLMNAKGDFPRSLIESVAKWGTLTEKQLAAVYRCIARDNDRAEERKKQAKGDDVDLSAVFERFEIALEKGIKRPRMNVIGFKFSLAPAHGKNAGHLYVKDSHDEYLGKVSADGKLYRSRECTPEQVAGLQAIADDVLEAAKAYGQKHGQCSFCSRELSNKISIALSMGPICADNFGFPHDEGYARSVNPEAFED